jgi:hypothetical protein
MDSNARMQRRQINIILVASMTGKRKVSLFDQWGIGSRGDLKCNLSRTGSHAKKHPIPARGDAEYPAVSVRKNFSPDTGGHMALSADSCLARRQPIRTVVYPRVLNRQVF